MSRELSRRPTAARRQRGLALACVVAWLAAAAGARSLGLWLAIGGAACTLGCAVLVLDHASARSLLRPRVRLVLFGVAVGGAMAVATYVIYPLLARVSPLIARDTAALYAAFRAPSRTLAAIALVPVIVGEELVWRGLVQTMLVQRVGPARGVACTAVAYALAHAPLGSPVLVCAALACGSCWGALRARTASLVPTLVAHVLWDVLVLWWLPLVG